MQRMKAPWRHESELAMIRDWFFPQHAISDPYSAPPVDMRQRAIGRVELWSFKDPDLTHAIIATASLTEAILHDEISNRESYISDSALQSIYAMAFCRFVNGLVDRDVAKAATASLAAITESNTDEETTPNVRNESSMYSHARKIELPISFVELRHQATHGRMPSLGYLRTMTRQGLEWLYEKWWRRNATASPDRALRALELERVETEERRCQRQLTAGEKSDIGAKITQVTIDGDREDRGSSIATFSATDEMLGVEYRNRKRGFGDEPGIYEAS
jgi:Las1-like